VLRLSTTSLAKHMNTTSPNILLTGAAGYIGSHTALALLAQGYSVVGVDNHCNSSERVVERVRRLADMQVPGSSSRLVHVALDVRDEGALGALLDAHSVDACIHFAALKAVGESTAQPLAYLHNNMGGLLAVLNVLQARGVDSFVFSSSATVYGDPECVPLTEGARLQAVSPYGVTKLMGEQVLAELSKLSDARQAQGQAPTSTTSTAGQAAHVDWRIATLRYFNPVGAHESGEIGEHPQGAPNNLMPYITQTATGQRPQLTIYGNDYATPDGTGVRDYIHVLDIADGHVAALRRLLDVPGSFTVNLGTGRGTSVQELIDTFERVNGVRVPHVVGPRRPGDVAQCYADASLAKQLLGWQATRTLDDMCRDAWRWQSQYPRGFE
jgi:UDP-glucose 4-epimerase